MESREEIDIKSRCALCKSMPCCPEHCCNVFILFTSYNTIVGQLQMFWLRILQGELKCWRIVWPRWSKHIDQVSHLWKIIHWKLAGLLDKNKWQSSILRKKHNQNSRRKMKKWKPNLKSKLRLRMELWSLILKLMLKKSLYMLEGLKESEHWGNRETSMPMKTKNHMRKASISTRNMRRVKSDVCSGP